jgi:ribosome-associated translation inhibitor RaiA
MTLARDFVPVERVERLWIMPRRRHRMILQGAVPTLMGRTAAMTRTHHEVEVQVQLHDGMEPQLRQYAREKVTAVLGHVAQPILFATVRLNRIPNPAATHPVTARAEIDVNGQVVCATASADTPFEAVDLLQDRLRARIDSRPAQRQGR